MSPIVRSVRKICGHMPMLTKAFPVYSSPAALARELSQLVARPAVRVPRSKLRRTLWSGPALQHRCITRDLLAQDGAVMARWI